MSGRESTAQLDPELQRLVGVISDPSSQGEPLVTRDYWLLAVITVVIPAILIAVGLGLS